MGFSTKNLLSISFFFLTGFYSCLRFWIIFKIVVLRTLLYYVEFKETKLRALLELPIAENSFFKYIGYQWFFKRIFFTMRIVEK